MLPTVRRITKCLVWMAPLAVLYRPALAGEMPEELRLSLHKLLPGVQAESVRETPMKGLYEVTMGAQVFYMSADGKYLIQGNLVDVETRTNLTDETRNKARKAAVDAVGEDQMVIFAPDAEAKHIITVFTDIDCGYCRKLHSEMAGYNENGIEVRYMFFPRSGLASPSYDKAVSVWCADDRKQALTDAKSGKEIESKTCDNPVAEEMRLGESMGVTGTPAIVLEDGELVPGYIPPARLADFLDAKREARRTAAK